MGFFDSVKQFFGIGGVDVSVQCPAQIQKQAGGFNGTVTLSSKSDLHVLTLEVKLVEEFTSGRGDDRETEEFELGKIPLGQAFDIKAGEVKQIPFQLPFQQLKSSADQLADQGGALGALGKVARFAGKEESEYYVVADCDVKGTAMDPSGKQQVQLI